MSLVVETELTPSRFAEIGRPAGAYRRSNGGVVALVSDFDLLYWPARGTYEGHWLRHRISLYSADLRTRLGVFDGARYPINDVAFHPSHPVLAVATGSYDGGWCFEGEFFLWNWETTQAVKVLSENREVSRIRFVDSDTLALLLRPRDEEEYGEDAAFDTFIGGTLNDFRGFQELGLREGDTDPRIARFVPIDPGALHLHPGSFKPEDHERQWREDLGAPDFEPRHRVWDVAWLGPDRLLAVHDRCHLESWSLTGRREHIILGDGHGVQLLRFGKNAFVHVLERANVFTGSHDKSTLLELRDDELVRVAGFDHGVLFSVDRAGRFLCRDTGDLARKRERRDAVIDSSGRILLSQDLGHYDCFNHYLRIDSADDLYFLRGTPAPSHKSKVLCRIDTTSSVKECFRWDTEEQHLMCGTAWLLSTGTLVRTYRVYDAHPQRFSAYVEAHEMPAGRRRWRRSVSALVTCLTHLEGHPWLIYALTNGRVGVLHAETGDLEFETNLHRDGVSTVALSMCALGDRIAFGTIDGRLLLLRIEERMTSSRNPR
jgi:WD40 repeat protein